MCCEVRWFLLMLVVDDFVITVNITNECKKTCRAYDKYNYLRFFFMLMVESVAFS